MAHLVRPPATPSRPNDVMVFLAGSMSKPWREELTEKLDDLELLTILDPTVPDWVNVIGEEDIHNPGFIDQVSWEHQMMEKASIHVFHFDEKSLAPVSLLEFGMFQHKDAVVHLEPGYEKDGHIRFIAGRYSVPLVETIEDVASFIRIKYRIRTRFF